MRKTLLFVFLLLTSLSVFAQTGAIRGKVVDGAAGDALIGANVVLKGTSNGAPADIDGNFVIKNVAAGTHTVLVTYIGYEGLEKVVKVKEGETVDLGTLKLEPSAVGLSAVEIVAAIAEDRKTPVAASTVKADFIEAKLGAQEFPEILKVTPGVYTTKTGGGYGDSRINLRGFNSENVAVMINGVPVNDMENGRVYWSNWAGLSDVTQTMQVQRGLGASRVAVPSIGGTINILTKTSDAKRGGSISYRMGNNGFNKTELTLSTGLTENNWAVTVSGSKTQGEGWADGTQFEGYSYFLNVSKLINDNHQISFTGFGAPQVHGQRYTRLAIQDYRDAPQGLRYNADWGYLNGQVLNVNQNFYHKPQLSLNHYWTINGNSELSTSVYASFGTGGGTGTLGNGRLIGSTRTGDKFSPIDFDAIVEQNSATTDGNGLAILRASRNDHKWYGALSTYDNRLTENIRLLAGIDLRYYRGMHFREVSNLLGADYFYDNSNKNNPGNRAVVGDKVAYNNDGLVLWEGGFLQAEYSQDRLTAFVSLAGSNTSYKRIDYFRYLDSDPKQETDWVNYLGYNVKGGANYNLTERHNVFANVGYFEKAPFFNASFLNNDNIINEKAENQKILSYELGYGYRSSIFSANVNLYRTNWRDRTFVRTFPALNPGENPYYANVLGVNALHQGVEIDFVYQPVNKLRITGMASFGDWVWQNNVENIEVFDDNQQSRGLINLYIEGLKVGDAAQTTMALTADYEVFNSLTLGATVNHYDDLYADYDPNSRNAASKEKADLAQSWKLPSYQLLDFNVRYKFDIAGLSTTLYGNVNNVLDTEYISDAFDNTNGSYLSRKDISPAGHSAAAATVYYGLGRTYTLGLKVKF